MAQKCPVCNNDIPEDAEACPFCGFKLLGSTQSFKPVGLDDAVAPKPAEHHHPQFKVVRGPQTGITIALREGEVSVGRNPQCDVFLNDMTVSRRHATIVNDEGACTIRDENSFNGVWVNNQSIDACRLHTGDVVQIGAFCLVFDEN